MTVKRVGGYAGDRAVAANNSRVYLSLVLNLQCTTRSFLLSRIGGRAVVVERSGLPMLAHT